MLSDEMHDGLFQHRGGQPPAGEVLLATVLDEAPGDVVAEPLPVFLFGVARRQPVAGLVEELACQWRCCTARSKSLTSLCRLQSHPAQYVSGIPSAAILLSISHPIRCSTRCLANVRARISGPMIAL